MINLQIQGAYTKIETIKTDVSTFSPDITAEITRMTSSVDLKKAESTTFTGNGPAVTRRALTTNERILQGNTANGGVTIDSTKNAQQTYSAQEIASYTHSLSLSAVVSNNTNSTTSGFGYMSVSVISSIILMIFNLAL
jgi:hypothetical protein